MTHIRINMSQFKAKWQDYADNIQFSEKVRATNGDFLTLDSRAIENWLNIFAIFYTKTV